jgi:hypothetical protein
MEYALNDALTAVNYELPQDEWPVLGFTVTRAYVESAEPDVGIMEDGVIVEAVDYYIDSEVYKYANSFVGAVCARLGINDFDNALRIVNSEVQEAAEADLLP